MIVVELDGTGTVACGRAAPTPSVAKPKRSNRVGMSRVHLVRGGSAARTRAIEVTRTAAYRLRRRNNPTTPTTIGIINSENSAHGQLKVMGGGSRE
jgi:hypothetical protein